MRKREFFFKENSRTSEHRFKVAYLRLDSENGCTSTSSIYSSSVDDISLCNSNNNEFRRSEINSSEYSASENYFGKLIIFVVLIFI